jgi:hypothetical protein
MRVKASTTMATARRTGLASHLVLSHLNPWQMSFANLLDLYSLIWGEGRLNRTDFSFLFTKGEKQFPV